MSVESRFAEWTAKSETCWLWTGPVDKDGFGQIQSKQGGCKIRQTAHRLAYQNSKGVIPKNAIVVQSCHNKLCVRPEHLQLGDRGSFNRVDPAIRFWRRVLKSENCWLWTGSKNNHGYGVLCVHRKAMLAHRFSYALHLGEIQEGLDILHKCDTPACVNPDHLFPGTHKENMLDAAAKGRLKAPPPRRGESHPMHRLTKQDIQTIKDLAKSGVRHKEIAARFKTSKSYVSAIYRGVCWRA